MRARFSLGRVPGRCRTAGERTAHSAVAVAVRVRERLAPAVHVSHPSHVRSPRETVAPQYRLPSVRRLRRRTAQRLRRCSLPDAVDRAVPFPPPAGQRSSAGPGVAADDLSRVADPGFVLVGVASRPGSPVEPAARSPPFGRASFAPPLASLAARPLPGGSLRSPPLAWPPMPCVAPATRHIQLPSLLAGAARPARLRLRRRASARLAGLRCRERRLAPLAPSGVRSVATAAPRRLASRSDFPGAGYPGSGPSDSLRWPDSHTPRSGLPRPPPPTSHYARLAFQPPSSTPEYYRIMPVTCREKFRQSDGVVQSNWLNGPTH